MLMKLMVDMAVEREKIRGSTLRTEETGNVERSVDNFVRFVLFGINRFLCISIAV